MRKRAMIYGLPLPQFGVMIMTVIGTLLVIIFSFGLIAIIGGFILNAALYIALIKGITYLKHVTLNNVFPKLISNRKPSLVYHEKINLFSYYPIVDIQDHLVFSNNGNVVLCFKGELPEIYSLSEKILKSCMPIGFKHLNRCHLVVLFKNKTYTRNKNMKLQTSDKKHFLKKQHISILKIESLSVTIVICFLYFPSIIL